MTMMLFKRAKAIISWVFPVFVICFFPFRFYYDIMHYQIHHDDLLAILLGLPCVILCLIGFIQALKRREKSTSAVYGLAMVSCIFFCYWIIRIPLCPVCDSVSRSDLGFMLEPFADKILGS